MKVAIYARVSTTDKGQDVDLQLYELRRFAQVRGWEAVEFIDDGVSGAKARRPALDELLKAVKQRRIKVVAVWKMDRLGRSLTNLLHLMNEFETCGVAFVSLRENIDLTTAAGRLMAQMIGAFAEFEREICRERVRAGIANARRKGKTVGRTATSPIVLRQIIELAQDPKQSMRMISKKTKVSLGTVQSTISHYKQGLIDLDGFKAFPLLTDAFEPPKTGVQKTP